MAAKRTCSSCGVQHFSVTKVEGECLVCRYFELCRGERLRMADAIEFLRDKGLCAYCGEYGDEVEHVVPRCAGLPTYTLPACRECNGIALGRLFKSFEDKATFIRGGLSAKYQHVLQKPEWTDDEIDELGKNMRAKIRALMVAREVMLRRISWDWIQVYWHIERAA